jgi:MFS family permease
MALERRLLIWMCVLVAVNQLGFGAMIPSLPLYAQTFGVPASAIGLAVAIYGFARFATAIPSGTMSDRLGRRPTLAIGGLISAVGNLWCAWASGYPEFIVARFVAGAGAGLILTTGQVVLADISTPERRGRTISIYQGSFLFAVGVGPFPGGLLASHYGLAAPFVATGIASLVAAAVAWFAITETKHMGQGAGKADTAQKPPFHVQIKRLYAQTGFLLVSLIALMNAVVRTGGLFMLIPVLVTDRLAISPTAIGFGLMLGGIGGLLAAYPSGWLTDRYGRKAVIVPANFMTGLSMLLFCFVPSYVGFLAASIVWGIASSVGGSAPAAYAADSAPAGMNASAMSTFRMTADAGYVIGPLALGFIADVASPVVAVVIGAGGLVLISLMFAVLAPETYRGLDKPAQ